MAESVDRREKAARLTGIAVALGFMAVSSATIRWPAPAIAAAIGFGAYLLTRGKRNAGS